LLGAVDISPWAARLNWFIAGGESGPKPREMDLWHLYDIVQAAKDVDAAMFVNQDSGRKPVQQGRIKNAVWKLQQYPTFLQ